MPSSRILSQIILGILAIAPVATVATFFRNAASSHPLLYAIFLIIWEVLLFVGRFLVKVYGKLQDRWVDRTAEWSDAFLRRVFSSYPRQYRYFLSRMHHDVDLRGLSTWGMHTLAMDEVFVDLSLMPQSPHRIPTGPIAERDQRTTRVSESESPVHDQDVTAAAATSIDMTRRSIWETLDQYPDGPVAILGPPGSGKTTLLRHVTLALSGRYTHTQAPRRWRRKVPLLLFLREHSGLIVNDPTITLADVTRRTLIRLAKKEPPGWLERQLDGGHCVVMLDGLDEVARREDRAVVMRWVRDQISQNPKNRFILTSRPFGFTDPPLISATVVQVRQFTDTQVETFVKAWYQAVEQRSANRNDIGVRARAEEGANKLLDRLYTSPSLLALATNPLLLTMITSVHKYRAALPGSRAELYREICQVFLGKRQEAKELPSELSIEQKMLVLRHLAYAMMERRIRDITDEDATALIALPLENVGYHGSPTTFLIEMEQTTGLVVERDIGVYAFVHLTFQEYLAAVHLAEVKSIDFLTANLSDSWWREVILLRVATTDATPIVRAVLETDSPTAELLSLAADCVDQAREVDISVKKRLAEMLSWRSWEHDATRRRVAAQVLLERKLRQVIRSKNRTFICTEPISNAQYHLFLQDGQDGAALQPGDWTTQTGNPDTDELPVVGVSPQAATQFVKWMRDLGLDVRLPKEEELTRDDYRRVFKSPALQFWTHPDDSQFASRVSVPWMRRKDFLEGVVLSPIQSSPKQPDFADLLLRQLYSDASLLRHLLPPSAAPDLALSGTGPVEGNKNKFNTILRDLEPEAEKEAASRHISDAHGDKHEYLERIKERLILQRLETEAGDRLSRPLPDTMPTQLFPERYSAMLPTLVSEIYRQWNSGGQWEESLQYCGDIFAQEMLKLASGMDPRSLLFRAYERVIDWSYWLTEDNGPTGIPRLIYNIRRFSLFGSARRRGRIYSENYMLTALAQLYLIEWRISGLLPRHEGLLLVRE